MKQEQGIYYVRKGASQVDFWCLFEDDHIILKGKDRESLQAVCASMRRTVCYKCKCHLCQEPNPLH